MNNPKGLAKLAGAMTLAVAASGCATSPSVRVSNKADDKPLIETIDIYGEAVRANYQNSNVETVDPSGNAQGYGVGVDLKHPTGIKLKANYVNQQIKREQPPLAELRELRGSIQLGYAHEFDLGKEGKYGSFELGGSLGVAILDFSASNGSEILEDQTYLAGMIEAEGLYFPPINEDRNFFVGLTAGYINSAPEIFAGRQVDNDQTFHKIKLGVRFRH